MFFKVFPLTSSRTSRITSEASMVFPPSTSPGCVAGKGDVVTSHQIILSADLPDYDLFVSLASPSKALC